MPSAHLPRGQVITVQRTPQIESLIQQGFVDVIEEHPDTPEPEGKVAGPVPVPEPTPTPEVATIPEPMSPVEAQAAAERFVDGPRQRAADLAPPSRDATV